jgi:hypothetical protein
MFGSSNAVPIPGLQCLRQCIEMGASAGTVCIAFDQPAVHAGQNVTGKVNLSVDEEELSCSAVGCRIVGEECVAVTGEDGVVVQRRVFIDMKACLRRWPEGVIRRGQYELRFMFKIPAGAPATTFAKHTPFVLAGGSGCCGFINYTMEVWLDRPASCRWDVRSKCNIVVTPAPTVHARTPLYMQPQRLDLRSLFIFHHGNVWISGQLESNVVYAGATTSLKFAVMNLTRVRIVAVDVKLTQFATFSVNNCPRYSANKLFCTRLTPEQAGLNLGGSIGQQDQDAALQQLGEAVRSEGSAARTPVCTVRIPVPFGTVSSYHHGEQFRVRYELKIKLVTTIRTCSPWVTQQIHVVNPAPVSIPEKWLKYEKCTPARQLPFNWAPHTEPTVVIPEIALDMGALTRDQVGGTFEYDTTAQVAPAGYSVKTLDSSAPSTPSVDGYTGYAQAEAAVTSVVVASAVATPSIPASTVPAVKLITTAQFVRAVGRSPNPCAELENFLRQGYSVDNLRPDELYWLLTAIPYLADQLRFAEGLARNAKAMTCSKVASIAAGAVEGGKGQVTAVMLATGRLQDRGNAHLIQEQLSEADWLFVKVYLQ